MAGTEITLSLFGHSSYLSLFLPLSLSLSPSLSLIHSLSLSQTQLFHPAKASCQQLTIYVTACKSLQLISVITLIHLLFTALRCKSACYQYSNDSTFHRLKTTNRKIPLQSKAPDSSCKQINLSCKSRSIRRNNCSKRSRKS